jgi:hypothetical protein
MAGAGGYAHGMSIASELRLAGLTVVEGREGRGQASHVAGIDVVPTKTGVGYGIAADINNIVSPADGVAYIERSGRVWLLADGPLVAGSKALVFVAQQKGSPNDQQKDSLAAVLAILEVVYATDAPESVSDALESEIEPDPVESEDDAE